MSLEILAPAGNMDQLIAAVRCGANAVYLGGINFNARRTAANFNKSSLLEAVKYCHERDVKVHLALNTLITDNEINTALNEAQYACEIGIDAIIIQDIGLASLISRAAPDMPLHASTQMSVHTVSGLKILSEMGFTRAVIARECSKDEITDMIKNSPIELEMFIHGALCMSVSGQCYMSAMFGSRSGNRGLCAQPCRLPFSAPDNTANALSLKDLSLIDYLPQIEKMGITSVKIEGRLKRPEYVAAAVTACRETLKYGKCPDDIMDKLKSVFSRSGFTSGYYNGNISRDMFGIRRKEDVTKASNDILSSLSRMYDKENPLIPVNISLSVKNNLPACITVIDNKNTVTEYGQAPQTAINKDLDKQRCITQLSKTGNTPFYINSIDVDIDKGLSLPISEINALRRNSLDKLLKLRGINTSISFDKKIYDDITLQNKRIYTNKPKLWARFIDINSIPEDISCFDYIFIPADTPESILKSFIQKCIKCSVIPGVELPRALFGLEYKYSEYLKTAYNAGIRDCMCGNIGAIPLAIKAGMRVHGGIGLNITNGYSLDEYSLNELKSALLSFELSLNNANKIYNTIPTGLIIYGHLPLMLTRSCPAYGKCIKCSGNAHITDRKDMDMPIICSGAGCEILNPMPVYMFDRLNECNCDYYLLYFTNENSNEVRNITDKYLSQSSAPNNITRGLYFRGVE